MNTVSSYSLLQAFAEVADFRNSRGWPHPLLSLLALGCTAALCGASGRTAASQWRRDHSPKLLAKLGFTHFPGPSPAHTVSRLRPSRCSRPGAGVDPVVAGLAARIGSAGPGTARPCAAAATAARQRSTAGGFRHASAGRAGATRQQQR